MERKPARQHSFDSETVGRFASFLAARHSAPEGRAAVPTLQRAGSAHRRRRLHRRGRGPSWRRHPLLVVAAAEPPPPLAGPHLEKTARREPREGGAGRPNRDDARHREPPRRAELLLRGAEDPRRARRGGRGWRRRHRRWHGHVERAVWRAAPPSPAFHCYHHTWHDVMVRSCLRTDSLFRKACAGVRTANVTYRRGVPLRSRGRRRSRGGGARRRRPTR